jgi:hypothetical protein
VEVEKLRHGTLDPLMEVEMVLGGSSVIEITEMGEVRVVAGGVEELG